MGTIAKGEITLSPVNDAYTVLLTPASCVINADFDGSNPKLQNATTTLIIKRGTKTIPFSILSISKSSVNVGVLWSKAQTTSAVLKLFSVPKDDLDGWIDITFRTADGFDYTSTIRFNFTVVRETSMLDWILDWEGSKTKVGGAYIMTPKLFVGHKDSVVHQVEQGSEVYEWAENAITGVYLGPDLIGDKETVGLYGYFQSKEIFHLNADGGMIGGWNINEAGISSGNLKILGEGTIIASSSTETFWALYANGNASFANGNVVFYSNGNALFSGQIESSSGLIGGWRIAPNQINNNRIIFDSAQGIIGVYAGILKINPATHYITAPKTPTGGGVVMYYTSSADFGLVGCSTTATVFRLGSTNFIAGWSFDDQAIYIGTKNVTQNAFTVTDSLTISPTGIRSSNWYIDKDGTAKFVGGSVAFDTDKAEMFGWKMREGRFSSAHAALISNSYYSGVFVSPADLSEIAASSLVNTISNNGGIYMYSDGANSLMRAYDVNGNLGFALQTNGFHTIGNWHFNHQSIYIGSPNLSPEGYTLTPGSMVLATSGITGFAWKLNADGSGSLASGKIKWDTEGNLTVDAKISANNITAGTISTAAIKNGEYWGLNLDGSGYLASSNIIWDKDGNTKFIGEVNTTKGVIGGWTIAENYISSDNNVIMLVSKSFYDSALSTYYQQGIYLASESATGGSHVLPGYDTYGAKISLIPSTGTIEASLAKYTDYSTGTAYISPTGIFANLAGTQATSVGTGLTHHAAIVGLGFAKLDKDEWELGREMTAIAGVYGRASNSGTAPAYGGYFIDLKACGLIANMLMVSDSTTDGTKIGSSYTYVCGITNSGVTRTLYLPTDGVEGRIIIVKQLGAGSLRIDTQSGQTIYDDNTANDYYDVNTGQMAIFTFQVYYINKVRTEVWSVNRFKF